MLIRNLKAQSRRNSRLHASIISLVLWALADGHEPEQLTGVDHLALVWTAREAMSFIRSDNMNVLLNGGTSAGHALGTHLYPQSDMTQNRCRMHFSTA